MKLLLLYPPYCTPTSVPYSISYLKSFLNDNVKDKNFSAKCIDINAKWHKLKFNNLYEELKKTNNIEEYGKVLNDFKEQSGLVYYNNHQLILENKDPEFFNDIINQILKEKPTHVALSFVYNSQVFWGTVLINKLKEHNIKCYVGGPAITDKLKKIANYSAHEVEFLEEINKDLNFEQKENNNTKESKINKQTNNIKVDMNNLNCNTIVDFNDYEKDDYLSKEIIIPIRTSTSCPYKQCTFCTHHGNGTYFEYNINNILETIKKSKFKNVCFIDDYILPKRLKQLTDGLKGEDVKWWIQTKPVKEIIPLLKDASNAGLRCISWGVESGSQDILDKIKKGTNISDINSVLEESKKCNIKNVVYVMFGFPSETKEQFVETIDLLKKNDKNIDIVSTTIFGLQRGSYIYSHPEEFSIKQIHSEERTLLPPKITYDVVSGMTTEQATRLKSKYSKTLKKLNKLPQAFNIYKEQIILF